MSDILEQAATTLSEKLTDGFDASAKFVLTGLGALVLNDEGVSISDDDAEVTLTADPEVFQDLLAGDLNPTSAFMSGKLSIDGDMSIAMKLASFLAS